MHIPVLQKEVLQCLNPKPNENFIDCTIGEGGHTLAILEKTAPKGKVLGIEWDPELYNQLREKCLRWHLKQRLILVNDSFTSLKEIVKREKFGPVSGILFDLGMSSWHLEESGRGFSFLKNEPLIMRYDWKKTKSLLLHSNELSTRNDLTAAKIVNGWPESEIERILKEYGQERFAKIIAREIVNSRKLKPIKTTFQLVEIIKKVVPGWYRRQPIHSATRTFQALRIAVNDELNNLEKALPQALDVLKPGVRRDKFLLSPRSPDRELGGRLAIISFHSLEDKIVKNFYRGQSSANKLKVLTKKPVRPSKEEIKINPRSRSAKLRAVIKL